MSSPKFIISRQKVFEQFEKIKNVSDVVSYSSKTNSLVSSILEEKVDCMFSIHLANELKNIKDFSKVLFLAQGWKNEDLKNLVLRGVKWFVVDNERDLKVLENFLESFEGKLNVLLRVKLKENTLRTEKYFVFGMSSSIISDNI